MSWTDSLGPAGQQGGRAALTFEAYRDTPFYMYFFRYNQDDILHITHQMPHSWDPREAVRFHIHALPMSAGAGNVRIDITYAWVNQGTELPAVASWNSSTIDTAFVSGDQYMEQFISTGDIVPPAGSNESAMLLLHVKRPGASDAADTYQTNKDHGTAQANLGLLSFDIHYRPRKVGTQTEFGPV